MDHKIEGTFALVSAILVIFVAMLDPLVSVILSASLMVIYAIYTFAWRR